MILTQHAKSSTVFPKYISVRNAEAVTGQGYRWCRDTATSLGVPIIRQGRKLLIVADAFFEALERGDRAEQQAPQQDPAEQVRALLGKSLAGVH